MVIATLLTVNSLVSGAPLPAIGIVGADQSQWHYPQWYGRRTGEWAGGNNVYGSWDPGAFGYNGAKTGWSPDGYQLSWDSLNYNSAYDQRNSAGVYDNNVYDHPSVFHHASVYGPSAPSGTTEDSHEAQRSSMIRHQLQLSRANLAAMRAKSSQRD